MRRWLVWLVAGFLIGVLSRATVETQAPLLMFGTLSGAPKAIAVDASGNVSVKVN